MDMQRVNVVNKHCVRQLPFSFEVRFVCFRSHQSPNKNSVFQRIFDFYRLIFKGFPVLLLLKVTSVLFGSFLISSSYIS